MIEASQARLKHEYICIVSYHKVAILTSHISGIAELADRCAVFEIGNAGLVMIQAISKQASSIKLNSRL